MNRIRDLRIARGWRQKDLAEAMHTTHQSIARYEAGERGLDVDMICTLCDIFGVTADYLLCRSDNPQPAVSDADAELLRRYRKASFRDRELVDKVLSEYAEPEPEISGSAG